MTRPGSVVHLSTADNEGGSGRAAYRIHSGLRQLGWQSRMLVGRKRTHDPDVEAVYADSQASRWSGVLIDMASRQLGMAYQWFPWSGRLASHPWFRDADIIQLFNLHGGYFPIGLLPELSRHAPIVWRLSDMWSMTGHCVYSGDCEKWRSGCGKCPQTKGYVELGIDTSALLWKQKAGLYAKCDITVVAPSSWTERLARESPLLNRFPVQRIPNGLDTQVFRPIPRDVACELMQYDPAVRRILFVAHGLDNNPRKGGSTLMEALRLIGPQANVELVLAGVGGSTWEQAGLPIPVRRAGYITDDRFMAALYSCADLMVVPSAVENLPNTLLEAMACGLPAVALITGGMADAVQDGATGYLVGQDDVAGFAARIHQLLDDGDLRTGMGKAARRLIEQEFTSPIQADRFATLYGETIARRKSRSA
jgi:glycosyltransferase involved in cell wall biosynthesis